LSLKPAESTTLTRRLHSGLFTLLFLVGGARESSAHRVVPAVLSLKEVTQNRFVVHWVPPSNGHGQGSPVDVRFPSQCELQQHGGGTVLHTADGTPTFDALVCTDPGLTGRVAFSSPGHTIGPVGVNIDWLTGADWFRVTNDEPPLVQLPAKGSGGDHLKIASDFLFLGVRHILGGVDHILFVLGLLLLVQTRKRLLITVTSFTLAHSITLTAATLGFVHLPSGPVEICIALSILLVAAETAQNTETVTRRSPWLIAFSFGLLHGFGFASALSSAEIPSTELPLALFTFNVGVEIGQLLAIGTAVLVWKYLPKYLKQERRAERFAASVLGSAATFWLLQRIQTWISSIPL